MNFLKNGCFWCLFDNKLLIGTVAVRIIDSDHKIIELKRMFVLPEYQGKGYGKLLLDFMKRISIMIYRIWHASYGICSLSQNQSKIKELIPYEKQFREATQGIELCGTL